MRRFVDIVVQQKASDDYRGFLRFRDAEGLWEVRGYWAPNPGMAAQTAWDLWQELQQDWPTHPEMYAEWIGE